MSKRVSVGFVSAVIGVAFLVGCEGAKMQSKPCGCGGAPAASKPAAAPAKPASAPAKSVAAAKPQAGKWALVFTDDFNGPKLGPSWEAVQGQATLDKGMLVLKAESEGQAVLLLRQPSFPDNVRMEFDASISGTGLSDMTAIVNASSSEPADTGYMFQFGGSGNTENHLRRDGDVIASTAKNSPLLTANKVYHVVAENDAGKLTLYVDDKPVFQYTDPKPLKGAQRAFVGLYTWDSTLKIDRVMIYTKEPAAK